MTVKTTHQQFCNIWDRLCGVYREPINTDERDSYWKRLQKYEYQDLLDATAYHIDHCKWFPRIAELIDAIPKRHTTIDDIIGTEPLVTVKPSQFDCSQFSDQYIMETMQERFQWDHPRSAEYVLKWIRKGSLSFVQEFKIAHENRNAQPLA